MTAVFPKYISELLLCYDSIVFPGLGTFYLQNVSAAIKGDVILPPGKILCYDATKKNNDGVLAHFISERERISFFDACDKILEYVESTMKELDDSKEVLLEGIGMLKKNSQGELVFSSLWDAAHSNDSFGLTAIRIPSESKTVEKESLTVEPRKKKIPWFIFAIIFVVIIGAGFTAVYFLKPDLLEKFGIHQMQKQTVTGNQPGSQLPVLTDSINTDQQDSSEVNMPQKSETRYYIIAASFRIKANADNYVAQLNSKGNNSESIFVSEKNLYAVSYNMYLNKAEAEQALEKIKASGNTAAWILEK